MEEAIRKLNMDKKRYLEDIEKEVSKGLKEGETLSPEKAMQLQMMKQSMPIIFDFLIAKCSVDPTLSNQVVQEHKSSERLSKFILDKARALAVNQVAVVRSDVVFNWALEYFALDDKEKVEKELVEKEEAERKAAEKKKKQTEKAEKKAEREAAAKAREEKKKKREEEDARLRQIDNPEMEVDLTNKCHLKIFLSSDPPSISEATGTYTCKVTDKAGDVTFKTVDYFGDKTLNVEVLLDQAIKTCFPGKYVKVKEKTPITFSAAKERKPMDTSQFTYPDASDNGEQMSLAAFL